jgi:hypothetical protein
MSALRKNIVSLFVLQGANYILQWVLACMCSRAFEPCAALPCNSSSSGASPPWGSVPVCAHGCAACEWKTPNDGTARTHSQRRPQHECAHREGR